MSTLTKNFNTVKENKSYIMKIAHRIAKSLVGDYQARLKMALKKAWAIYKIEKSNMQTWGNLHKVFFENAVTNQFNDTITSMNYFIQNLNGLLVIGKYDGDNVLLLKEFKYDIFNKFKHIRKKTDLMKRFENEMTRILFRHVANNLLCDFKVNA